MSSRSTANFCGFVVVFVGVMLLGSLIGFTLSKMLRVTGLSFFDRLLGAVFGILRGVLMAAALVMALLAFAPGARNAAGFGGALAAGAPGDRRRARYLWPPLHGK